MPQIEIYTKFKIHDGRLENFKDAVEGLVNIAKGAGPRVLRYDWFLDDDRRECIAMEVYADAAAMEAHSDLAGEDQLALRECAYRSVEVLTGAMPEDDVIPGGGTKLFRFVQGLDSGSAAAKFSAAPGAGATPHIEIYTKFFINPGSLDTFKTEAAELLRVVRASDTGTSRYDWFYDDEGTQCLALDTYNDAAAMFAHMKNCHDAHERLLRNATMVTEFLGALPEPAMAAVAKYAPYILPFFAGLKGYSAGGFG